MTLLALKQHGSVEEHQREYKMLAYQVLMHNPYYDARLFVAKFIKGIKLEIRPDVESQVPATLDDAIPFARIQQEVQADART